MKLIKNLTLLFSVSIFAIANAANYPDFTEIVDTVKESVVVITTEVQSRGRKAPGPSGSGFVLDDDGYVLTNRHVIEGVSQVYVSLINNRVYKAEVLGDDPDTDIALLKIDADDLKEVTVGNVERLKVGAWVLAYGAPLGLEQSVTAGIVSAKGRSIGSEQYVPFIQTDAAVNRGNSGGPLFNEQGEVVGINSQIFSLTGGNMGLAFAIPMDLAKDVADQLRENGRVSRGFLGVEYQAVSFDLAESLGLKKVAGAIINSVQSDSPADKGGIKTGDVVIKVDDKDVISHGDLPFLIGRIRPGTSVDMMVVRQGKEKTLEVVVGEREQPASAAGRTPNNRGGKSNTLGVVVGELTDQIRQAAGVEHGVVIRRLLPGVAEADGIREGDILQMLNQHPITSVEDFNDALESLPDSGSVAVLVHRRGAGARFFVLTLGDD